MHASYYRSLQSALAECYACASARLDRAALARSWAVWRGVVFVSSRTGRIAARLDEIWWGAKLVKTVYRIEQQAKAR